MARTLVLTRAWPRRLDCPKVKACALKNSDDEAKIFAEAVAVKQGADKPAGTAIHDHGVFMSLNGKGSRIARLGISVLALAWLAACGGGGVDEAPAADKAALKASPATQDTVASDTAQPASADPAVFDSDGAPIAPSGWFKVRPAEPPNLANNPDAVEVGEFLFKDQRLSGSGKMACATCHLEGFGHADAPGVTLPLGGRNLDLAGSRSSMTGRYLNLTPPFRLTAAGTPKGGYLWDGRADDRFEQVFHDGPFFNPVEMALPGSARQPSALTDLVRSAPYWPQLQALYVGQPELIATDRKLFEQIAILLEVYQRDDDDYNLFDSKYDQVQAGAALFSNEEARGFAIFSDKRRGNCMTCHSAKPRGEDESRLFTNFGYAALGVPRNHTVPANADPAHFDLGLCARQKADTHPVGDSEVRKARYCGLFKTPTLRNVERTAPYFHNASVATLEEAVRFHFQRDTHPQKWYRKADGSPDVRYNDLPRRYHHNLAGGAPFNGRYQPSDQDVADIVAFLKTLNDSDQTEPLPRR
jgi:cytochrome c peroxidase